jgi:hypothetical protein
VTGRRTQTLGGDRDPFLSGIAVWICVRRSPRSTVRLGGGRRGRRAHGRGWRRRNGDFETVNSAAASPVGVFDASRAFNVARRPRGAPE